MAFLYWLQTKKRAEGVNPRLFLCLFLTSCGQIPLHGFGDCPVNKGIQTFPTSLSVGQYDVFLTLGNLCLNTVISLFYIVCSCPLLCL